MAAIDTFEWLVGQSWPNPDAEAQRFIREQRDYLLNIRTENERTRYVDGLIVQIREMKKK
jgi:hypothetical protein